MSYTMEDFERDYVKEHFPKLTPEERLEVLQALSAEEQWQALERLPPERLQRVLRMLKVQQVRKILQSLPPREIGELLLFLPPEERQNLLRSLSPEKRLAGLSEEQVRQLRDRLTAGPAAKPQRKKGRSKRRTGARPTEGTSGTTPRPARGALRRSER